MKIGIGLPTQLAGVEGSAVIEWAIAAEDRGMSILGATDRISFHTYDPLAALAAAAAVTDSIELATVIVLSAARGNAFAFAKQAATVDQLSGGRLVLGVGAGGRDDDFSGVDGLFHRRGAALDDLLDTSKRVWHGELGIGPPPAREGGPPVVVGGRSPAAMRRMAERTAGWIGSGGAVGFPQGAEQARRAWADAGRPGQPLLMTIAYYALGDGGRAAADEILLGYYSNYPDRARAIADTAVTTSEGIAQCIDDLADAGCDGVVFLPCIPSLDQLHLLADAAGT